jgi:hypothetical protein
MRLWDASQLRGYVWSVKMMTGKGIKSGEVEIEMYLTRANRHDNGHAEWDKRSHARVQYDCLKELSTYVCTLDRLMPSHTVESGWR